MAERKNKRFWRRALLLALFLLIPALLYDLSILPKTGHKPAPTLAAGQVVASGGGSRLALLPLDRGAIHPGDGHSHWHTTLGGDGENGDAADDALLQNLVYLTHAGQTEDGNKPIGDGNDGDGRDGGDSNGGAPFSGLGFPSASGPGGGNDPGTDFLPSGSPLGRSGNPPFPAPTLPGVAAVPEPATWALFILGFGLTGFTLRRGRDARLATALTHTRRNRLG